MKSGQSPKPSPLLLAAYSLAACVYAAGTLAVIGELLADHGGGVALSVQAGAAVGLVAVAVAAADPVCRWMVRSFREGE